MSRNRSKSMVEIRHAVFYELRKKGFSYPEIASFFKMNHSTVLSALKNYDPQNNPYTKFVEELV